MGVSATKELALGSQVSGCLSDQGSTNFSYTMPIVHLKEFPPAARFTLWRSDGTRLRAVLLYIPGLKTTILGP
jgi:hypothetical protein